MATIQAIRRRIESAEDLQSVVKTMKALAAAHIWQYERAVNSLADYSRSIEMGLTIVLRNRSVAVNVTEPPLGQRLGAIIFGSDQGMVGRFNEQITSYALEQMNEMQIARENRSILSVGARISARLEAARHDPERRLGMPGSIAGITPTVQELVSWIETWRERRGLDQIVLFHHRPESGSSYHPHMVQLLPVDLEWLKSLKDTPWPTRTLPTFTMDWEQLFAALIRQHFFVALYRALAESLASENASRLASMQAAEKNIEERLENLNAQFHRERQRAITEELLDIVAGFEALTVDRGNS